MVTSLFSEQWCSIQILMLRWSFVRLPPDFSVPPVLCPPPQKNLTCPPSHLPPQSYAPIISLGQMTGGTSFFLLFFWGGKRTITFKNVVHDLKRVIWKKSYESYAKYGLKPRFSVYQMEFSIIPILRKKNSAEKKNKITRIDCSIKTMETKTILHGEFYNWKNFVVMLVYFICWKW